MDVLHKPTVLVLNKLWRPIQITIPEKVLGNLYDYREVQVEDKNGSSWQKRWKLMAFNIIYPMFSNGEYDYDSDPDVLELLGWDKWTELPIRYGDKCIRTPKLKIKLPTVVMASDYDKMFEKDPRTDLSYLYDLYEGICQYSKKKIPRNRATRDHIVPISRGGTNEHSNIVLALDEINNKKGNKLNSECGLIDPVPIIPRRKKAEDCIRPRADCPEWNFFLKRKIKYVS